MSADIPPDNDELDAICCIGIFIIFMIILIPYMLSGDVEPYNTTEQIVDKNIGHTHRGFNSDIQYYIITENYTFEVDTPTYNNLSKGDNVTIEHSGIEELITPTGRWFRE